VEKVSVKFIKYYDVGCLSTWLGKEQLKKGDNIESQHEFM